MKTKKVRVGWMDKDRFGLTSLGENKDYRHRLFCIDEVEKVLGKRLKEGMKLALINLDTYNIRLGKKVDTIRVSSVHRASGYCFLKRNVSGRVEVRELTLSLVEMFLGETVHKGMVLALVDLADYDVEGF